MSEVFFDFIVIGGGSAGYAAARTFHGDGYKVAVVDGGKELSGLCILQGCMPSKTLIYSAEVFHLAKQGSVFGFENLDPKADMRSCTAGRRKSLLNSLTIEKGN